MTQEDLVRFFFAKDGKPTYWEYCFNEQCPLAKECIHQLSAAFKDSELTHGSAIFPDAYRDGTCKHFLQFHLVKTAWGFVNILQELKKRDEASFRVRMISYFGSSTSFYRYKLGQIPLKTEQQQYVLGYLKSLGYDHLQFDRYTEEIEYMETNP